MSALLLVAALATADAPPARDWAATLRSDATALHDRIAADHPGPYNRLDPGFARRNDAGLRLALTRAARVTDFAGYQWAMRGYVASFDDGHVQFSTLQGSPLLTARWPGFLTGFDGGGRQVVLTRADDAPAPLGAVLEGCDGVRADRLLATNVGAFVGRWSMAATRVSRAGRLFVDTGNPFIRRPSRCRFTIGGVGRTVALVWRPLVDPEWARRVADTAPSAALPIGAHTLADGTRWFAMSSFDSDPAGSVAQRLRPLIAGIAQDRAAIGRAPRIVLDLRGNGGGSSQWSDDLARALWGDAAVDALPGERSYVEWRASPGNLARIERYRDAWARSPDASPASLAWARRSAAGLADAIARKQPLWRAPDDPAPPAAAARPAPATALDVPVYVLTDSSCASACLDAVDLWTSLGAVPIGRETSGDTLYMEVGDGPLPSGIAEVGVPMKVYRGRRRGSNEPVRPRHAFAGDMRDSAAVERWVATLPARS